MVGRRAAVGLHIAVRVLNNTRRACLQRIDGAVGGIQLATVNRIGAVCANQTSGNILHAAFRAHIAHAHYACWRCARVVVGRAVNHAGSVSGRACARCSSCRSGGGIAAQYHRVRYVAGGVVTHHKRIGGGNGAAVTNNAAAVAGQRVVVTKHACFVRANSAVVVTYAVCTAACDGGWVANRTRAFAGNHVARTNRNGIFARSLRAFTKCHAAFAIRFRLIAHSRAVVAFGRRIFWVAQCTCSVLRTRAIVHVEELDTACVHVVNRFNHAVLVVGNVTVYIVCGDVWFVRTNHVVGEIVHIGLRST